MSHPTASPEQKFMRISIIGQAGSGKSTLAIKMSEKFNLSILQIDRLWFESGGDKLKKGEIEKREKVRTYLKEKVQDFITQDSWISDGWYPRVQVFVAERADLVIFLDIPLYRRLFNHLKRIFKNERHEELSVWNDVAFIYEIIRRTFLKGPKLKQFVMDHSDKVKTFKNYKQLDIYLNTLV